MILSNLSSVTQNHDAQDAYSNDLRPNKGEGSLGDDAPPSYKPTGSPGNIMVLDKWTGIVPVTETDSEINVRVSSSMSRVKYSCLSWFGPPPRSRIIPRIMRPTMVKTLIELTM